MINLYAVATRLKEIKTMLLLTVVNHFCMGPLEPPVSSSMGGPCLNNTCTVPVAGTGLTAASSSSEDSVL